MQDIIPFSDIKARAGAIGLTLPALSRLAALSPSTAWRISKGASDPRLSTISKLSKALKARETELLHDLQKRAAAEQVSQ